MSQLIPGVLSDSRDPQGARSLLSIQQSGRHLSYLLKHEQSCVGVGVGVCLCVLVWTDLCVQPSHVCCAVHLGEPSRCNEDSKGSILVQPSAVPAPDLISRPSLKVPSVIFPTHT